MRQLSMELSTLLQQEKYNESKITPADPISSRHNKEGCGDCEVDDVASCCNRDTNLQLMCKQNTDMESMACKVCMLLLPCQHL